MMKTITKILSRAYGILLGLLAICALWFFVEERAGEAIAFAQYIPAIVLLAAISAHLDLLASIQKKARWILALA